MIYNIQHDAYVEEKYNDSKPDALRPHDEKLQIQKVGKVGTKKGTERQQRLRIKSNNNKN